MYFWTVVQRELPAATYVPPPQSVVPPVPPVPERGAGEEAVETSPSAPQVGDSCTDGARTPRAIQPRNPFDDPLDHADTMMTGIEETPQGSSLRNMDTHMTSLRTAGLSDSDPFVDYHEYRDPSFNGLATHGYNASFQSTFDSFIDPPQSVGELRQEIVDAPIERTPLLHDQTYPEYIHDTLTYVSDMPPDRKKYYPLWNHILEYWFPSTQGFEIVEDWDPKTSFRAHQIIPHQTGNEALPPRPKSSFAVFDVTTPTEPFLFVQIHNALAMNDFIKRQARITMEESFETLRACSFSAGFESLCVISAVGAKWGMVVREAGWLEGETDSGDECIGEWEENVTGTESFRVMGYCFEEMKRNVQRRQT